MASNLWDVIAVDLTTGKKRLIAGGKTATNAEAIIAMAVTRRGVDQEIFTKEPSDAR